jgi:hypothetical protein
VKFRNGEISEAQIHDGTTVLVKTHHESSEDVVQRAIMESILSTKNSFFSVNESEPSIDQSLGPKVQPLFQDRLLFEYIHQAGIPLTQSTGISRKLFQLQNSIYELDQYGESNWLINRNDLSQLWCGIYCQLRRWGVNQAEAEHLSSEIKLYQDIELGLRQCISPTNIPIHRFYYLKTCDVRLSRRLVASQARGGQQSVLLRMWNCFDLVSEVGDDLTDIAEDSLDFNCNRFILVLKSKGATFTNREYRSFLTSIKSEMLSLVNESARTSNAIQLRDWFLDKLALILVLLERTISHETRYLRNPVQPSNVLRFA